MEAQAPTPLTTLAILLGASEWPKNHHFQSSQAFAYAARSFKSYLLHPFQFGLSEENLLDLFDTDEAPPQIDNSMRQFLSKRTSEMKKAGNPPRDLLVYYVGHGGFSGRNKDFYLALRCTSSENPQISSLPIESFASTITEQARYLRRIIILDCCYAASAYKSFQSEGPARYAINQTSEAFEKKRKKVGKGTTLLCSSGAKVPSLISKDGTYTMFSKALIQVLSNGNTRLKDKLSVHEVADLTEEVIDTRLGEEAPRPEVHSPEQNEGDVADVPFFPNVAASKRILDIIFNDSPLSTSNLLTRLSKSQEGQLENPFKLRPSRFKDILNNAAKINSIEEPPESLSKPEATKKKEPALPDGLTDILTDPSIAPRLTDILADPSIAAPDRLFLYEMSKTGMQHSIQGYILEGIFSAHHERYEEAIAAYDQAIRLDPNYALAYYNKGCALDNLGRSKEARYCYEKARQLGYKG